MMAARRDTGPERTPARPVTPGQASGGPANRSQGDYHRSPHGHAARSVRSPVRGMFGVNSVANTFRCRLVTPAASLLDSEVAYASIPAWDGLMGFLPGRAPILARLGIGELTLETADKTARSFFVDGGFVQMNGQTLTVLAERAVPKEQLVASEVQAELKSLEARVVPDNAPNRQFQVEALNKDRERARVKLRVAGGK